MDHILHEVDHKSRSGSWTVLGLGTVLESIVSELCWGLERLEPQCPARVSSLFGAIQGLAAGRPSQVNEGRVSWVEGSYPDRGQGG